ncbi:hypothetical protein BJ742DRAFT_680440 [Cladochytrium replicatum]|nr:hypothetical protein BJ742DRAFT_680440 [Cladochytrium replicatum]
MGKKGKGEGKGKGKGSAKKKNKEAEQEAANQLLLQDLKNLRVLYTQQSQHFITEPMATVVNRINKAIVNVEVIDKLIITSQPMSLNDMYALTTSVQTYNALNAICLWMVTLDLKALEALSKLFALHQNMATLHLIECGITESMSEVLASIPRNAKALTTLVVDHNPLRSSGLANLFLGIREHRTGTTLMRVSAKYCDCGWECCEGIASTLSKNQSIEELDLTGNRIGNIGLIPFSRALAQNKTLKLLNVASNQISDRDEPPISTLDTSVNTGAENTGLETLDLRGNHVGDKGGECLLEMLKLRKQAVSAKRAEPLLVHITERMREELFEKIWEVNSAMRDMVKKKGGGKKGKGKGKKKVSLRQCTRLCQN